MCGWWLSTLRVVSLTPREMLRAVADPNDPARAAAAAAAAELVEPDMLIGLGSGEPWKLTELLGTRDFPIRAATAPNGPPSSPARSASRSSTWTAPLSSTSPWTAPTRSRLTSA